MQSCHWSNQEKHWYHYPERKKPSSGTDGSDEVPLKRRLVSTRLQRAMPQKTRLYTRHRDKLKYFKGVHRGFS
jgi:hypothetical protein